jgi:peptide/nickel transport system ATP-binding protein
MRNNTGPPVAVDVENVSHVYRARHGPVHALDDVSFGLGVGETLAIIGESGSGKSTLTRLLAGLETPTSGTVRIMGATPRLVPGRPGPAQVVFQDPAGSLNPYREIWKSVAEPLRHMDGRAKKGAAREMLGTVGIEPSRQHDRPTRFSGGQLQRIAIARALVAAPQVLICDEPTSALDVSVQAQILNLLHELQQEIGFTCVFVTHDLAVAQVVALHVIVLAHGRVQEASAATTFFSDPRSSYGQALLASVVDLHGPGGSLPPDQSSRAASGGALNPPP